MPLKPSMPAVPSWHLSLIWTASPGPGVVALISAVMNTRSHLKKVFSANPGVATSDQVFEILMHVCGLMLGLALISSENPNFEMASNRELLLLMDPISSSYHLRQPL
jgi:hypothetical protein